MRKLLASSLTLSLILLFAPVALATTPQVYVAKISEDSTITAIVIENTLGTVTYSRIEEGRYRLSCFECFPDESKIVGLRSFHFVTGGKYYVYWEDEIEVTGSSLVIQTYTPSGVLSDNILSVDDFRIEVYP